MATDNGPSVMSPSAGLEQANRERGASWERGARLPAAVYLSHNAARTTI